MKYLIEYIEEEQSKLIKNTGTFFAFSNEQFLEQYTKDVKYVNMGRGMFGFPR